jgi:hypothetical protein
MTPTSTLRRATVATVLAGTAVLAAAPASAGVGPQERGGPAAGARSKAQVEHDERTAGTRSTTGLSPNVKSRVERMEGATHDPQPAPPTPTSDPSGPSSVPAALLALLGSTLVAGAAGYTVHRFRHHGPVGATTA